MLVYGIAPIFVGLIAGYFLGSRKKIQNVMRGGIAIIMGAVLGVVFSSILASYIPPTAISFFLATIASTGGSLMGLALNWSPSIPKKRGHHIIYEQDDEDSFDREIEDAMKGKYD